MAVLTLSQPPNDEAYAPLVLSDAQTGNGDSTNTFDRGAAIGPCLLQILTVVGATPTVTLTFNVSVDNTSFWPVAYATTAAPDAVVVAAVVLTTAATTQYLLIADQPWRYLKVSRSANTNVTVTATVFQAP